MYMMNIWIGTAMSYSGKQVFSLMLFHLFFIAAPGQNQDKCSNLMWSLDKLRIREDKNLLQKFGLGHSKHLCTFYVLGSHGFKKVSCCCCCCCEVASVVSDSVRPHGRQPTRLPRPWDSPGKNTGVGCHFLLQCMKVKSESEVAQSYPTLRHPTDCSLSGSSIHGIFQAGILEWGAIAFSEKGFLATGKSTKWFLLMGALEPLVC